MSEENQWYLIVYGCIAIALIGISISTTVAQFAPKDCKKPCCSEVAK
jgi:hypothetical protein